MRWIDINFCLGIRLIVIPVLLLAPMAFAQDGIMNIYGTTVKIENGEPLSGCAVKAVDVNDTTHIVFGTVRTNGKYELLLVPDRVYLVLWSSPERITKSILIDLHGPATNEWEGGFGLNIDLGLLEMLPEVDYSSLMVPYSQIAYNRKARNWVLDLDYADKMMQLQQQFIEAHYQEIDK